MSKLAPCGLKIYLAVSIDVVCLFDKIINIKMDMYGSDSMCVLRTPKFIARLFAVVLPYALLRRRLRLYKIWTLNEVMGDRGAALKDGLRFILSEYYEAFGVSPFIADHAPLP